MTLTKEEFRELVGLYDDVERGSYGSGAYPRIFDLEDKATEAQFSKAQRIRYGSKEKY